MQSKEIAIIILASISIIIIGVFLNWYELIKLVFSTDSISKLITIFVIANSLFSVVIPIVLQRKSLYNRRKHIIFSLLALWSAVAISLVEILLNANYNFELIGKKINNYLMQIAIGVWIIGVFYLLRIMSKILTLDSIKFNKTILCFKHRAEKKWGTPAIDEKLGKQNHPIYFPIIILADEYTRPWKILQNFIVSGLTFGNIVGGIYFTFTRPASEILDQLMLRNEIYDQLKKFHNDGNIVLGVFEPQWKNIVFIDCYTLKNEKKAEKAFLKNKNIKVFYADSNDPHNMNDVYEKALKFLMSERCCKSIRVVYDALSDFLTFTDFELATQYLRHNMGFEQRKKVGALYLFRKGTFGTEKENYFLWFANGVLNMQRSQDGSIIEADFRGPFKQSTKFNMDFDFRIISPGQQQIDKNQSPAS